MGAPYLADGITGINLARNEEVVAFLISRNTTFPFDERVNEAPVYPCDLFRINSLPIFGKTDDATGIQVDADQLGVQLALQMGGCASWDEFQTKAIRGKGVSFAVKSRTQQTLQERQADARARTYGLFVISKETFLRVKRKARFLGEKPVRSDASLRREQVGQVMALYDSFFEMQRFMKGEPTEGQSAAERIVEDKRKRLTGLVAATSLEGATEYQNEAGDLVPLPMLSRVFGTGHGSIFGRDFQALSKSLGFRGADLGLTEGSSVPPSAAAVPGLTRFVELLWETQRLYTGMRYLNAHVAPSMASGQRPNRVDVIEMSRQTIEAAFLAELGQLDGTDSLAKEYREIRLQLTRAKTALAKLEQQYDQSLAKVRAAAKANAPDPIIVRDIVEVVVEPTPKVVPETLETPAESAVQPKRKPGRKLKVKQATAAGEPKVQEQVDTPAESAKAPTAETAASEVKVQPEAESQTAQPMDVDAVRERFGLGKVEAPF
jgi:hypothetical protein